MTGVSQQDGMSEGCVDVIRRSGMESSICVMIRDCMRSRKDRTRPFMKMGRPITNYRNRKKLQLCFRRRRQSWRKNGTLRLEKVYQQKERMEKPKEQPALQESLLKQREKESHKETSEKNRLEPGSGISVGKLLTRNKN